MLLPILCSHDIRLILACMAPTATAPPRRLDRFRRITSLLPIPAAVASSPSFQAILHVRFEGPPNTLKLLLAPIHRCRAFLRPPARSPSRHGVDCGWRAEHLGPCSACFLRSCMHECMFSGFRGPARMDFHAPEDVLGSRSSPASCRRRTPGHVPTAPVARAAQRALSGPNITPLLHISSTHQKPKLPCSVNS